MRDGAATHGYTSVTKTTAENASTLVRHGAVPPEAKSALTPGALPRSLTDFRRDAGFPASSPLVQWPLRPAAGAGHLSGPEDELGWRRPYCSRGRMSSRLNSSPSGGPVNVVPVILDTDACGCVARSTSANHAVPPVLPSSPVWDLKQPMISRSRMIGTVSV